MSQIKEIFRDTILEVVEKETDWIVMVQKYRTWYFDVFFKTMSFLGGHLTYMICLPVLFWFGHAQFARHATWLMALGLIFCNFLKDFLYLPRPKPPVTPFSKKYSAEFGFPSSHSVNALSFPLFACLYYLESLNGDIDSMTYTLVWSAAILFCVSVCFSRIYCGMHSGIDIIGGILIGALIFSFWMYNFDSIERWMTTEPFAWLHSVCFFLVIFSIYPSPPVPTPSFEDSCCFAFASVGIVAGTYLIRQESWSIDYPHPAAVYYSYDHFGLLITSLRVALGVGLILVWRIVAKNLSGIALRNRHEKTEKVIYDTSAFKKGQSNHKINKFGAEFLARAVVYSGIGAIASYFAPALFQWLGIGKTY